MKKQIPVFRPVYPTPAAMITCIDEQGHLGSHDVFVGEAVMIHAEDWALDERGLLDPVKARALAFMGRSYWAVGPQVRRAFTRRG